MIELDPGHRYLVEKYDGDGYEEITFMKRIGAGYPGNTGTPYPGTNAQELLRVQIKRLKYVDNQIASEHNHEMLKGFNTALYEYEWRAARRHGLEKEFQAALSKQYFRPFPKDEYEMAAVLILNQTALYGLQIEDVPHCRTCGHIVCHGHGDK